MRGAKPGNLNPRYSHGMFGTRTYRIWRNMKYRCGTGANHKKNRHYKNKKVCKEWADFEMFLRDMGEAPEGKSLDRIDNSNGYFKENCRWANIKMQNRNKITNQYFTLNGKTQTYSAWAEELGMSRSGFRYRAISGYYEKNKS